MEGSFVPNSVLPFLHSILPPEILLRILSKARITDIKNCRLVSSSWNQYGVQVLRKVHPVLPFPTSGTVKDFMAAMPIGTHPFSAFKFSHMEPHVLLEFLRMHGSIAQELHLNIFLPPLPRPYTFEEEANDKVVQEILNFVFCQTPRLKSLEFRVSEATLPNWDNLVFVRYPLLTKLELWVTEYDPLLEMERFVEEMMRRSPTLLHFAITNGTTGRFNPVANSKFLDYLPRWLKKIPRHMRVTLRLGYVTDDVLPLLNSLMLEPINLVNIFIDSTKFHDATVLDLFCKWLFQQPLEGIELGDGIYWKNKENIFKECKQLTLNGFYFYPTENIETFRSTLSCFPNVTHLTLFRVNQEWLVILGTMLPRLEHLSCARESVDDPWEVFTGLTPTNVFEIFMGVEVVPTRKESPFRELKALKILDLEIEFIKDLLPILYSTQEGMMPRLRKLNIRLAYTSQDSNTVAMINKYGLVLSTHHDTVVFTSGENPPLRLDFERTS